MVRPARWLCLVCVHIARVRSTASAGIGDATGVEPRSVEFADRDNLRGGVLTSSRRNQETEQGRSKIRQLSDNEIVAQLNDLVMTWEKQENTR
jgi:hypothetical protein